MANKYGIMQLFFQSTKIIPKLATKTAKATSYFENKSHYS
jgi:hypothetical protein